MSFRTLCRAASCAALLAPALLASAPAEAATQIRFVAPQNYTDGNLAWSAVDQRLTLEGLERIMKRLSVQYVPRGYDLDIEVRDVDLAGKIDPLRAAGGSRRVMREDTWPRMSLFVTVRKNGRIVSRGEQKLSAINYLMDPKSARSDDPLRFEKAMLTSWFRSNFKSLPAS